MDIVGHGFLARSLRPIADRHQDVVVLAAGVSWASGASKVDFTREAALLDKVARQCLADGRRLLFFSTASAGMYGATTGPGREDIPVVPCNPYGEHKYELEKRLLSSEVDFLILRLGHLVGPGQPPHQLIPSLVRQILRGSVRVHRGAVRDLIDVDDVVRIIDLLLGNGVRREIVNVASGVAVPVEQIVDYLEARLGTVARRVYEEPGFSHSISTEKLRTLVPEINEMGFGADYYRRVLGRLLVSTAASSDGDPGPARREEQVW